MPLSKSAPADIGLQEEGLGLHIDAPLIDGLMEVQLFEEEEESKDALPAAARMREGAARGAKGAALTSISSSSVSEGDRTTRGPLSRLKEGRPLSLMVAKTLGKTRGSVRKARTKSAGGMWMG